ncbi:MAG: hypothetical protein QMD11_08425 [Smithella sp.]|nr:hypothetical protein [Smithella sp.]
MRKERNFINKTGIGIIVLLVSIAAGFSGCAAGFSGIGDTTSWQEEG